MCEQEAKITLVRHAFFIGCVLGCAAVAHAQSSSVLEWPPKPPPDMAQPPPSDLGAPPSDLGRPAAPSDMKPAAPATPAPSTTGGGPGGIKSI
ncbi:MAG: hypothetical protein ACXWCE_19430, partial [Caldimonas sp.]